MRVLRIVSPVLEDAENKQERFSDVKTWFNSLRHAVYQADDVLDEINIERLRIEVQHSKGDLSDTSFSDQFIGELAPTLEKICAVLERNVQRIGMLGLTILDGKQKRGDKPHSTYVVKNSEIFGRDDEKEKIIQMVLSGEGNTDISVIPITGMGGIGKTTLAQLVYNDERVRNRFKTKAWICISHEFDVYRATKDLLKEVNPSAVDEKDDLNCLQVKLKDNLEKLLNLAAAEKLPNDISKCLNLQTLILANCNLEKLPEDVGIEDLGLLINLQHLDISGCSLKELPKDVRLLISLQHLNVSRCSKLEKLPEDIGLLINLQHLDISSCSLKELPKDMRLLISLQHLNVSRCSKLEKLPEDTGLLINLQHLDISHCSRLKLFPKDMGLLINLQYLNIDGCSRLEKLPEDVRNLINLQLYEYRGVVEWICGATLKQLDKLKIGQLLRIWLNNAVTVEMAKNAELKNQNCIENLTLEWNRSPECSKDELKIFAELIPHTNISQLRIWGYKGTTFSNWLGDSSFCNIEEFTLYNCKNCILLPPLGQLTGLKRLEISGMDGITEVGEEFYGNFSICKPFQVLEKLIISNMAEWTTWNMHPDNADFLSLREFRIRKCPKLVGDIPFHLTSLRTLKMNIIDCPSISLYLQSCGLKRLEVENCKHVEFLPDDICNSSLESLKITECGGSTETIPLFSLSKLQELSIQSSGCLSMFEIPNGYPQSHTSLQSLTICNCNNILSFPQGGLPAPNLKELEVVDCSKLKSLPEQMHTQLSSLRQLRISDCPEMECFPDGGLPPSLERLNIGSCKRLTMFPRNWGLQRLRSLIYLSIWGIEDKLFPEEGLLPASLKRLDIALCPNLEALNHKGFQYTTSLKQLRIQDCPELRYLPEDGLASSLSRLLIRGCPKLKACTEDWPKVSHIPIIEVEGKLIS